MTADLVAFLRARLDEDERAARAATSGPWRYDADKMWNLPGMHFGEEFIGAGPVGKAICVAGTGPADDPQSMADAAFIARHDPARVLREVEAKRDVIVRCEDQAMLLADHMGGILTKHLVQELLTVVRVLALPYADHEDYRTEWAPAPA